MNNTARADAVRLLHAATSLTNVRCV